MIDADVAHGHLAHYGKGIGLKRVFPLLAMLVIAPS